MENFLNQPITVEMALAYILGTFILSILKGVFKGIKNSKNKE